LDQIRALLLRNASRNPHNQIGVPPFERDHSAQETEGLLLSLRPNGTCIDKDEISVIRVVRWKKIGIHEDLSQVI
jgi:hypothetical protein